MPTPEPEAFDVVVMGAGYGGLMAALRLQGRRNGPERIALVSRDAAFLERIRLQESIVAPVAPRIPSLAALVEGSNLSFVQGEVIRLDVVMRQVQVATAAGPRTIGFRYAVYALGSTTNVNGPPGLATHAYRLDGGAGALSAAALRARLQQDAEGIRRVVVVGGAETAIEAAGEIRSRWPHIEVVMVARSRCGSFKGPRVERALRAALERLGVSLRDYETVAQVWPRAVVLESGERIACDLCVWSGGLRGSPLGRAAGVAADEQDRIWVDPCLRALDHPCIFVVGDAARPIAPTGAPYRMSAFAALNSGAYAADAIRAELAGRRARPFAYSTYGQGIAIGRVGVGFFSYPNDKPRFWLVTGRAGIVVRNFFVRLLVEILKLERRWPGAYPIVGRRRVSRRRADAAMAVQSLSARTALQD